MSTFTLPPLRLPFTGLRVAGRLAPPPPVHDPVEHAPELDHSWQPVSASTRDIVIPDVLPLERRPWRRPREIRRRAS